MRLPDPIIEVYVSTDPGVFKLVHKAATLEQAKDWLKKYDYDNKPWYMKGVHVIASSV